MLIAMVMTLISALFLRSSVLTLISSVVQYLVWVKGWQDYQGCWDVWRVEVGCGVLTKLF